MGLTYLPDTNACIYALNGRLRSPWPVGDYVISAITLIELFSKPNMSSAEETSIRTFIASMTIVELPAGVRSEAARLRSIYGLKLPNAVIAATAITRSA